MDTCLKEKRNSNAAPFFYLPKCVSMRNFYLICFCLAMLFNVSAQSISDTLHFFNFSPASKIKASVHLNDNSVLTGIIAQITDSTMILSSSSQEANGVAYTSITIAIKKIKTIKIKRHAFFLGMGCGAVITGLIGYEVGYSSYSDKPLLSDNENKDNANAKGYEDALIGAVPGAVIGSLVGSVIIKRKFIINGDIKNIQGMIKTLSKLK